MGGTWSTTTPPTRPGAYFNFVQAAASAVSGGVGGVAAVIGTGDWGPTNQISTITSQAGYEALYGTSENGTLRTAALGALDGTDLGGAGQVVVYRAAASDAAVGTSTLAGATSSSLILNAAWPGDRANNWSVTVQTNAKDATAKDIILYEGTVELDRWERIEGGTVTEAAARITAANLHAERVYIVPGTVTGTGILTNVANQAFTGGDSGLTLTSDDFTAAFGALEGLFINTVALGDISDDTTLDLFAAWVAERNTLGQRFFGVIGGAADELLSDAEDRATEYNNPDIVNVGATDVRRLSDDVVLSTAQLAPRVAGAVANTGVRRSVTFLRLTGYQVNNPLTGADYTEASLNGVLTFTNHSTTAVRIEQGVTSLWQPNDTDKPTAYQHIRNVAISHYIETTLTAVAEENYLGAVPNTDTARRDLVGNFLAFLKTLEQQGVLQSGSIVELDDSYQQTGNAVYIKFAVGYVDAIERVFTTVKIG